VCAIQCMSTARDHPELRLTGGTGALQAGHSPPGSGCSTATMDHQIVQNCWWSSIYSNKAASPTQASDDAQSTCSSECTEDGDVYLYIQHQRQPHWALSGIPRDAAAASGALNHAQRHDEEPATPPQDHQPHEGPGSPLAVPQPPQPPQPQPRQPAPHPALVTMVAGCAEGFVPAYRLIGLYLTASGYAWGECYCPAPAAQQPAQSVPSVCSARGQQVATAAAGHSRHERRGRGLKRSASQISTAHTM
jgi:hypothetical protein